MEANVMAKDEREALLWEVARAVAQLQSATYLVDEAAAGRLGINRTDLRVLGLLLEHGAMTAGRVGAAAGLSPAATTVALDRLERAGYAQRLRDSADRRSVLVEPLPVARAQIEQLYGPVGREGMERLTRYSDEQLALLRDFLAEGYRLQVAQAERIRGVSDTASAAQDGTEP
jgi:DNA-binding MarR family transcriptional regulator